MKLIRFKEFAENFWEKYEKEFHIFRPPNTFIRSLEEAKQIIGKIIKRYKSPEERYWLLMFALTDYEIMFPDPRRLFDFIMESSQLERDEKIKICLKILESRTPFNPEDILSKEDLKRRLERCYTDTIKGIGNLENYDIKNISKGGIDRLISLIGGEIGLSEMTPEYLSLPQFRYFKPMFPRYAINWLCKLEYITLEEITEKYLKELKEVQGYEKKAYILGLLDLAEKYQEEINEKVINKILEKGKIYPDTDVRKTAYRIGFRIKGESFLKSGLMDSSKSVRNFVQKLYIPKLEKKLIAIEKEIKDKKSEYLCVLKKEIEKYFGELDIHITFPKVVAIFLAAQSYPETIPMSKVYSIITKGKDIVFTSLEQANLFAKAEMDLWNYLVSRKGFEELEFLIYVRDIENYLKDRCDEIKEYLDIIFFKSTSDLYRYGKESQNEIKYIKDEYGELRKILMNKSIVSTIKPSIIQNRIIEIWKKIFLIKELEKERRIRRPEEKSYQQPFPITKKRVGRNDPCPCGSGKKYKYCCMN